MKSTSKTPDHFEELHDRIVRSLMKRFEMRVITNVWRGDYVECMIAQVLGKDWTLPWEKGEDWASWDIKHRNGAKIEVKQSSARQTWDRDPIAPHRSPSFDIAPRTGYFESGSKWVEKPGRPADVYVFAWHGERASEITNHTNPDQWRFYVVAARDLPENQKTIGLSALKKLASSCGISDLKRTVEDKLDTLRL
ncbi:MAG: hypothetical protein OXI13_00335 [Gammaproteobacteria bacterium]|nr:hypothetical protein [Gammaproteobacteria bacterium]